MIIASEEASEITSGQTETSSGSDSVNGTIDGTTGSESTGDGLTGDSSSTLSTEEASNG